MPTLNAPAATRSIQAETIRSALTATEFALGGARSYLFVFLSGSGTYRSGDLVRPVEAPGLIWAPVNHGARLSVAAGSRGHGLRIPEVLLGRAMPSGSIARYVRRALQEPFFGSALPDVDFGKLAGLIEEIAGELHDNNPGAASIVQHSVSLLLLHLWRASNPRARQSDILPSNIVHGFINLVEMQLSSHWTVARYASELGVSKDRLNDAVRRTIGTSPHRYVQNRLIDETKTLLLNSDMQVAEIGYRLGFSDASYFNRFFQRQAQIPPARFRRINRAAEETASLDRQSFAAWP